MIEGRLPAASRYQRYEAPPDVRWHTRAGPLVRQALDQLASLPLARIIVAHSDSVEHRPVEQLWDAWRFVPR